MSEHDEQVRLFALTRHHLNRVPELRLLFAIPNGGWRHPVTATRLRDEGVRAGIPDLFLAVPRSDKAGLFIEMKVRNGRPTKLQAEWLAALDAQGYRAVVCHGCDEAWRVLCEYLEVEP